MTQQERRRHRRLPLKFSVTCRKAGTTDGRLYTGSTVNVSPGGMLIELGRGHLPPGQLLSVEVSVPPTNGLLEFGGSFSGYARVIRTYPDHNPLQTSERTCSFAVEFCQPPRLNV